ncbi:MAG: S41 family peptidase [Bacteroidota bacterium]
MRNILYTICLLLVTGYSKAQYLDEIFKKLHDPKELRKDVDFVRRKLEKEHINLYKFITKKELDYKFDSLKQAINKPMISLQFNARLLSVLSTIGDGHLASIFDQAKFSTADMEYLQRPKKQRGIGTLDYRVLNKKLYIKQNNTGDNSIKVGDEIVSIENKPADKIIDTMMRSIPSDGYNQTYKTFTLNQGQFDQFYNFLWDAKDTTIIELKQNNTTRLVYLKPPIASNVVMKINNAPNISYKFLKPDSTIVFLKVRTFMLDSTFKGFDEIFKTIKKAKTKTLVLDLRGNTGGKLGWSSNLFSYLTTKPGYFFNKPDELIKNYLIPGLNKLRDKQIKWYKQYNLYSQVLLQRDGFWGDLYVLTDGGTFSAASLLTANLKKYRAVTIVGEETGGSRNIWTAGEMKTEILPESKMLLVYGILPLTFGDLTDNTGRGTMPDIPINYTIADIMAKKDLEMDWVLKDITKKAL